MKESSLAEAGDNSMNPEEIQRALDDVFDQAVLFHSFTDYMRDYEIITHSVAAPSTVIPPTYHKYLFRYAVEVTTSTTVTERAWAHSLDDRLIDYEQGRTLDGYVWGIKWHLLYPGGKVVENSNRARFWTESLGIEFHEIDVETNAHRINIVFSELEVTKVDPGYSPFVAGDEPGGERDHAAAKRKDAGRNWELVVQEVFRIQGRGQAVIGQHLGSNVRSGDSVAVLRKEAEVGHVAGVIVEMSTPSPGKLALVLPGLDGESVRVGDRLVSRIASTE